MVAEFGYWSGAFVLGPYFDLRSGHIEKCVIDKYANFEFVWRCMQHSGAQMIQDVFGFRAVFV